MPANLQVCTHCCMLALLSNAVLAAVVTQAPLKALGSQTGDGGVIVPGGIGVVPPFLKESPAIKSKIINSWGMVDL